MCHWSERGIRPLFNGAKFEILPDAHYSSKMVEPVHVSGF